MDGRSSGGWTMLNDAAKELMAHDEPARQPRTLLANASNKQPICLCCKIDNDASGAAGQH